MFVFIHKDKHVNIFRKQRRPKFICDVSGRTEHAFHRCLLPVCKIICALQLWAMCRRTKKSKFFTIYCSEWPHWHCPHIMKDKVNNRNCRVIFLCNRASGIGSSRIIRDFINVPFNKVYLLTPHKFVDEVWRVKMQDF